MPQTLSLTLKTHENTPEIDKQLQNKSKGHVYKSLLYRVTDKNTKILNLQISYYQNLMKTSKLQITG